MVKKKGRESNWQFDFRPLKIKNQLDFLACKWRATCSWKDLDKGYKLWFRPHLHQRSAHKVMRLQSRGNPSIGNFGTPIWESWDKKSFGYGPRGEA
jgi:hypothetical protein